MLQYTTESLARCKTLDEIIVATSDHPEDDAIALFCRHQDIPCVRGSLDDVAGRFATVARQCGLRAFVRVCGDSPLLDWRLVDASVDMFNRRPCHMVTNVLRRSFPKGQSVEVLDVNAFLGAQQSFTGPEREHITRYFHTHPGKYLIREIIHSQSLADVQLSVDTLDDLRRFESIVARLEAPHWEYTFEDYVVLAREAAP